jgi:hypothetical protein
MLVWSSSGFRQVIQGRQYSATASARLIDQIGEGSWSHVLWNYSSNVCNILLMHDRALLGIPRDLDRRCPHHCWFSASSLSSLRSTSVVVGVFG